jgi:hypothetical protein
MNATTLPDSIVEQLSNELNIPVKEVRRIEHLLIRYYQAEIRKVANSPINADTFDINYLKFSLKGVVIFESNRPTRAKKSKNTKLLCKTATDAFYVFLREKELKKKGLKAIKNPVYPKQVLYVPTDYNQNEI